MLVEYELGNPKMKDVHDSVRKEWKDNHPLKDIVSNPYRWDVFTIDKVELE
jgi:hypothetical protein